MAEFTGAALYVALGGVVLSTDYREWEDEAEMGLVDASAGADTNVTYLETLLDGKATLKGLVQSGAANAVLAAMAPGSNGTLMWGPEGSSGGSQKYSVNAIVKSLKKKVPYKDVVEFETEFQFSGAITPGTF